MTLQGFDREYYLKEKLVSLQAADPFWLYKDTAYLETVLHDAYGLSAETHYKISGYLEGLAPNAFFNAEEYSLAKATQLVQAGLATNLDAALNAFKSAWPGNPYEHYLRFGAAEGLNPSNSFDDSSYLTAKLASLQSDGPNLYQSWSIVDLRSAFNDAGLTPLGHYLAFGVAEGLQPAEVPAGERVASGEIITYTVAQALAAPQLSDRYIISDSIGNLLTSNTTETLLLSAAYEIQVNSPATVTQITTLKDVRGYSTVNSYSLEDSLQNLFSADHDLVQEANGYSLSNTVGTSLGLLSSEQYAFVQDAANYSRGKWDFDTNTYLVGSGHDAAPYAAIVYITAKFADGTSYSGSGVVVGKNDILTASHLIYDDQNGGLAKTITVYPGRDGSDSPFGSFIARQTNYFDVDKNNDGLLSDAESEYDLAILGFSEALGNSTGWFGLDPHQTSNYYNLSGYPGVYADRTGPHMTNDYGYATEDDYAAIFNYASLSTNPGNSGGPLWYEDDTNGMPYVAGIVSTGSWATDVYAQYATILNWINGNDYLLPVGSANSLGTSLPLQTAPTNTSEDIELTGINGSAAEIA